MAAPTASDAGEGLRVYEATALGEAEVAAVPETVRQRVLDLFERDGILDGDAVADMRQWAHSRE